MPWLRLDQYPLDFPLPPAFAWTIDLRSQVLLTPCCTFFSVLISLRRLFSFVMYSLSYERPSMSFSQPISSSVSFITTSPFFNQFCRYNLHVSSHCTSIISTYSDLITLTMGVSIYKSPLKDTADTFRRSAFISPAG